MSKQLNKTSWKPQFNRNFTRAFVVFSAYVNHLRMFSFLKSFTITVTLPGYSFSICDSVILSQIEFSSNKQTKK